jgi:hypothetical protein
MAMRFHTALIVYAALPGATIERISKRQDLEFRDFKGNEIPQSQVDKDLADGKWRIVASLSDETTSKPKRESSYLIWSSAVSFGAAQRKR